MDTSNTPNFGTQPIPDSDPAMQNDKSNPWGNLKSMTVDYNDISLNANNFILGRLPASNFSFEDKRISGKHCKIRYEKSTAGEIKYFLEDLSTNGTFLNNNKLNKNTEIEIFEGDEISLIPRKEGVKNISFKFTINKSPDNVNTKPKSASSIKKHEEEEKKIKFDKDLEDEMVCSICTEIIHQAISLMPCLHSFCAGCYSLWLKNNSTCPQCRKEVTEAKRNSTLNNIINKFLDNHPEKKRNKEDLDQLDKQDTIKLDIIKVGKGKKGRKSNENYVPVFPNVPQNEIPQGVHLPQSTYMMLTSSLGRRQGGVQPLPENNEEDNKEDQKEESKEGSVRLKCLLCNRIKVITKERRCKLCNKGICAGCSRNAQDYISEIKSQNIKNVKKTYLNENKYEQDILISFLKSSGLDITKIIKAQIEEIETKKEKFQSVITQVELKKSDLVCQNCFQQIIDQLIYKYRESIGSKLPEKIRKRPNCWFGKECTTQTKNDDHAKKYNHICENTKK